MSVWIPAGAKAQEDLVRLPGHLRPGTFLGSPAVSGQAEETIPLAIVLAPRDPAGLQAFVDAVHTPGHPLYHRFLTSQEWTDRFGPTQETFDDVIRHLEAGGLTVLQRAGNRQVIYAGGNRTDVERLFHLQFGRYRSAGGLIFRAPNDNPAVPTALGHAIRGIVGLNDLGRIMRRAGPPEASFAAGRESFAAQSPQNLWDAYGLVDLRAQGYDGRGQTIAIATWGTYQANDVTLFNSKYSLPQQTIENIVTAGPPIEVDSIEWLLDIDASHSTGTGANQLIYQCDSSDSPCVVALENRIVSDNRAAIISMSYGVCESVEDEATRNAENQIFLTAVSQGITPFAATGDDGSAGCIQFTGSSQPAVNIPSSYPNVVAVGGTTLSTSGSIQETAWSGSGGGYSLYYARPAYQTGNGVPAGSLRGLPDVAANANPSSGLQYYYHGNLTTVGGTSLSAPIWAGLQATINQARGGGRQGLVQSAYYQQSTAFRDITAGSNGAYSATSGWDLVTGMGAPNAAAIVNALAGGASCSTLTIVANPAAGGVIDRDTQPDCPTEPGKYKSGTVVGLTARPATGYRFVNWSGATTDTTVTTKFSMDVDRTATANFELLTPCTNAPQIYLHPGGPTWSVTSPTLNGSSAFTTYSGAATGSGPGQEMVYGIRLLAAGTYTLTLTTAAGSNAFISILSACSASSTLALSTPMTGTETTNTLVYSTATPLTGFVTVDTATVLTSTNGPSFSLTGAASPAPAGALLFIPALSRSIVGSW